jgi:hypothetical protein
VLSHSLGSFVDSVDLSVQRSMWSDSHSSWWNERTQLLFNVNTTNRTILILNLWNFLFANWNIYSELCSELPKMQTYTVTTCFYWFFRNTGFHGGAFTHSIHSHIHFPIHCIRVLLLLVIRFTCQNLGFVLELRCGTLTVPLLVVVVQTLSDRKEALLRIPNFVLIHPPVASMTATATTPSFRVRHSDAWFLHWA